MVLGSSDVLSSDIDLKLARHAEIREISVDRLLLRAEFFSVTIFNQCFEIFTRFLKVGGLLVKYETQENALSMMEDGAGSEMK